jgi:hypothetical protein
MNLIRFDLKCQLILLCVNLPLYKLSILRQSHVLIFKRKILKLFLEGLLFHKSIRQLIDKLVKILSAMLVLKVLVLFEVAILEDRIYLIIGCIVSIIRKKTLARILMKTKYSEFYMFLRLVRRSSIFFALLIESFFEVPLISYSNFFCSSVSFFCWLSHSLFNSEYFLSELPQHRGSLYLISIGFEDIILQGSFKVCPLLTGLSTAFGCE